MCPLGISKSGITVQQQCSQQKFTSDDVRAKDLPSFDNKAIYIYEVAQSCKPDPELTMQTEVCMLGPQDCGHAVCMHLAPT